MRAPPLAFPTGEPDRHLIHPNSFRLTKLFFVAYSQPLGRNMTNKHPKPIVLTVLDGWGFRAGTAGNAIALARKPNYDRLLAEFPNTLIGTSGPSVGLPEGQMGNSEVGHMNMGAGRVVQM